MKKIPKKHIDTVSKKRLLFQYKSQLSKYRNLKWYNQLIFEELMNCEKANNELKELIKKNNQEKEQISPALEQICLSEEGMEQLRRDVERARDQAERAKRELSDLTGNHLQVVNNLP